MEEISNVILEKQICVIIGASHAGVNLAFALRKEGWEGNIILFDKDPLLPYHRPPLSKTYLTEEVTVDKNGLRSRESYVKEHIMLKLGIAVSSINEEDQTITLLDGTTQFYDKLVLATGARPIIPPIKGVKKAVNLFTLRTAHDVIAIKKALTRSTQQRVVVIGGGYIGLEIAASLKKIEAQVTVLEREDRILARVTTPEMSDFFEQLHLKNEVTIHTQKDVVTISTQNQTNTIVCSDGSSYDADLIIIGVGVQVNNELALAIGLEIEANGIKVNEAARTSSKNIYAIGDCTFHYNPHYQKYIRLESVQNAIDQAKIAAAAICDKSPVYNSIPWFWSDQYDVKLQMVGLSQGYTDVVLRKESGTTTKFSLWYFKEEELLAVDAINNAKAYMLGTKFIKEKQKIDKFKLGEPTTVLKPANLVLNQ